MRTLSEGTSEWVRGIVAGLVMVLALATVSAAQENPATEPSATAAEQPSAVKAKEQPKGGMGEGFKVHGHWTIEIKNSDGSLASHHEFENALTTEGQRALVSILARTQPPETWLVSLSSQNAGEGPCGNESSLNCLLDEPSGPFIGTNVSKNLTLTPLNISLQLSGSITATATGAINSVATYQTVNLGGNLFTSRTLDSPIQVLAGQILQVKVVFSFS